MASIPCCNGGIRGGFCNKGCYNTKIDLVAADVRAGGICPDCEHSYGSHPPGVAPPAQGVTFPPNFELTVTSIPNELVEDMSDEGSSTHASKMFSGLSSAGRGLTVATWFRTYLVLPTEWHLTHPEETTGSNKFSDYRSEFLPRGLAVWDIYNKQEANTRLLVSAPDGKSIILSGRGDYLITRSTATKASYLHNILCVIEIQSKDNVMECELQILVYLLILMNTKGLAKLVGFLVRRDGQCRAFRATRSVDGSCMYEQNDLFHVSHIAGVCEELVNEF